MCLHSRCKIENQSKPQLNWTASIWNTSTERTVTISPLQLPLGKSNICTWWTDGWRVVDHRLTRSWRLVYEWWTSGSPMVDGWFTSSWRVVDEWWTSGGRVVDEWINCCNSCLHDILGQLFYFILIHNKYTLLFTLDSSIILSHKELFAHTTPCNDTRK